MSNLKLSDSYNFVKSPETLQGLRYTSINARQEYDVGAVNYIKPIS